MRFVCLYGAELEPTTSVDTIGILPYISCVCVCIIALVERITRLLVSPVTFNLLNKIIRSAFLVNGGYLSTSLDTEISSEY